MPAKQRLEALLPHKEFHPVIPFPRKKPPVWLDFTDNNPLLTIDKITDTQSFERLVFHQMMNNQIGVGGYLEHRMIYRRSAHYAGQEPRAVHLGFDLWVVAGTPVCAPLDGKVHSFQDNQGFGNYGPTLILTHELEGISFYTLYGHLSRQSLKYLSPGKMFGPGEVIGAVGNYPENGDWPPHLHFQVMTSLEGYTGDFPGVAAPSQIPYFLTILIDPNLILQLP